MWKIKLQKIKRNLIDNFSKIVHEWKGSFTVWFGAQNTYWPLVNSEILLFLVTHQF